MSESGKTEKEMGIRVRNFGRRVDRLPADVALQQDCYSDHCKGECYGICDAHSCVVACCGDESDHAQDNAVFNSSPSSSMTLIHQMYMG